SMVVFNDVDAVQLKLRPSKSLFVSCTPHNVRRSIGTVFAWAEEIECTTPWGVVRHWVTNEELTCLEAVRNELIHLDELLTRHGARSVENLRRKRLIRIAAEDDQDQT
ncbi:MAG: hypothetical protein ACREMY_06785, partial [bacterium]